MSELPPTQKDVREVYEYGGVDTDFYGQIASGVAERNGVAFDRWLASVKADAWDEGWNVGREYGWADEDTDNPYRGGEQA